MRRGHHEDVFDLPGHPDYELELHQIGNAPIGEVSKVAGAACPPSEQKNESEIDSKGGTAGTDGVIVAGLSGPPIG